MGKEMRVDPRRRREYPRQALRSSFRHAVCTRVPHAFAVLLTTSLCGFLVGCATTPDKPALMASVASEDISVIELRATDYEFASRFGQLVAKCCAEITEATDDGEIRERALLWRAYASPQARAAAFNQDPLAGLIELWALAAQQRAYFTEGDGKDAFGDQQACAFETTAQLEREAETLAAGVIPEENFENVKQRVAAWAAAHPIEGRLYVRPTAQADLAALVQANTQGGLKAVGSMEETLRDLNYRIAILSVQVPVEARWQAEYLVNALFEERLGEPTDKVVETMDDISAFLDDFEPVLGNQVTRLLDAITSEREAAFAAIDQKTAQVLGALEGERVAVLDSVDEEVDKAVGRVEATGRSLIDHFFERLIGVLVAIGIFILIMVAVLIGALRTSRREPVSSAAETSPSDED